MDGLCLEQELPADRLAVTSLAHLLEEQLHALEGHVRQQPCVVQIEGELFREAFGIQIGVEHEVGALPGVSELTTGQTQPLVRQWVVGDPPAVEADSLALEEAG